MDSLPMDRTTNASATRASSADLRFAERLLVLTSDMHLIYL